ncbi:sulfite exporter TauE/SafE family protein [Pontibacterium granulatum]|uniref:sulfite exporter TauE/SafE family protein n=1 Tax=Pontibacterium granulatum TaxID=2036029 RepID=UPI00249C9567|nr:sulfite exporter TauE/SafE family protein [Pontibacterium granulatum]MDI3326272.1 sulfite exporter TauE/SafE family protein [Pontibacterium granulatum]
MLFDPLLLSIALLSVTLGAALQSLTGIGMAVIAAPVLILIEPAFLPAPILSLGCSLCILNTVRNRQNLKAGNIRLALYGRFPGVLAGIPLLVLLPQPILMIGFAVLIIFSVALSYHTAQLHQTPRNLIVAGFFSGLMGTTTSVGGPAIALVYQNSSPQQARAELGFYFLVGTLMSLSMLGVAGQISAQQVSLTLQMLPAVLVGFLGSIWLDRYFKANYLKPVIALLSLSSSALILWRAISQM